MTDKYKALTLKTKAIIALCVVIIILTGFMFIAAAGSGIGFNGQAPVSGAVGTATPTVSVNVTTGEGTVVAEDVYMKINDVSVVPSVTPTAEGYSVSYQPADKLMNGPQTVAVGVYDAGAGDYVTTNWGFTVDAAPNPSNWAPAKGSTVTVANPTISLYVKDTYNNLNTNTLSVTLDGKAVTPTVTFKGHWIYDSCGGDTWVVDSYREATISFNTSGLAYGSHTVEISIADSSGNVMNEGWDFNVATDVKFANHRPVANAVLGIRMPVISVEATQGKIDPERIEMTLNGSLLTPEITGIANGYKVSYTPAANLEEKLHTASVKVFDISKGVYKTTSWNFTVDATPKPITWTPLKGSTVTTSRPVISLFVEDTLNNLDSNAFSAKLNGEPANATFTYYSTYDSCSDIRTYNYKKGTVAVSTPGLKDGLNTVEISVADNVGNVLTEVWTFNVAELPKFSNLYPVDKSETAGVTSVSAKVTDNTAVDANSIKLYINNSLKGHTFNASTGIVTYEENFATGNYAVRLEAKDMAGNLAVANWSFITDTSPPVLAELKYFTNNMKITDGVLKFYARLQDVIDIKDNVMLSLNGNPLPFDFKYQGYVDSCTTGEYIVTSKKVAYASYSKNLPDGNHTLTLYAEDIFGHNRTWTWTFTVESLPTISNQSPVKYGIQSVQPKIAAIVKDNDRVDFIEMKLNGVTVNHLYNASTGELSYTPAEPLTNETNYTVNLTVKDRVGYTASKTWAFTINTYPDMADSNVSNCTVCHGYKSNSPRPYEAVHPSYGFWGHDSNCGICHNYIQPLDVCGRCHDAGSDLDQASNYPPHGLNPTKKYYPTNYSTTVPLRVTVNRENWDCIVCHQPGSGIRYRIPGGGSRLFNNHDIPQLHAAPLTAETEMCIKCHARSLTREHAREGRLDSAGQAITCLTCHQSTNPTVTNAIASNALSCTACHQNADHESVHVYSGMETNCSECHSNTLTTEHMNNPDTTGGKGYSCDTCHQSTNASVVAAINTKDLSCGACHVNADHEALHTFEMEANCATCHLGTLTQEHMRNDKTTLNRGLTCNTCHINERVAVKRTIAQKRLNCTGCHTQGHDVYFADDVPQGMPLYSGFKWTTPMDAVLFAGETGLPQGEGYGYGQVVVTNRSTHATALQIWSWYKSQLELQGWVTVDNVTQEQSFTAEFTKGNRSITLIVYNTRNRNGTGSVLAAGYRIELWYK